MRNPLDYRDVYQSADGPETHVSLLSFIPRISSFSSSSCVAVEEDKPPRRGRNGWRYFGIFGINYVNYWRERKVERERERERERNLSFD